MGLVDFAPKCSYPSWWTSNEQQVQHSLSKNISLKLESPPQQYHNATHLGLKLPDYESSSTQSVSQSHHEVGAVGVTKSQDQCISSESGQDESSGKGVEGQRKPVFLLSDPDLTFNPSQVNYNHSMAVPYTYADTYFGGLLTAYGPQTIVHQQMGPTMLATAPGQVLLPYGHGYIFVNAKQYPGILRRRQARAKLDAQNKPVKTRKPYLHESRHLHALNRVRGSGGRFLSTKKLQKPNPTLTMSTHCASHSDHLHQKKNISEIGDYFGSVTTCSDITSVSNSETIFQQPDPRFAGIFSLTGGAMQSGEGLMGCGTQNCASVVR